LRHRTENAECGIDQEAADGRAGAIHIALQNVVGQNRRRTQVAQEAAHAVLGLLRQHATIDERHRPDQHAVDHAVELENAAVQSLEGIVVVFLHDLRQRLGFERAHGRIGGLRDHLVALQNFPSLRANGNAGKD
jgi:hypothetical protein